MTNLHQRVVKHVYVINTQEKDKKPVNCPVTDPKIFECKPIIYVYMFTHVTDLWTTVGVKGFRSASRVPQFGLHLVL